MEGSILNTVFATLEWWQWLLIGVIVALILMLIVVAVRHYDWRKVFSEKNFRWFFWFGGIFAILAVIYLFLHTVWTGEENVNFSDQEIANIQTIVDDAETEISGIPDSIAGDALETQIGIIKEGAKEAVNSYIQSRYEVAKTKRIGKSGEEQFTLFLDQYAEADFPPTFLTEYRLKVRSYFWLTEDFIFLEIIFWSLFGVLCSLFYNISEAIASKEGYDAKHEFIHSAKLFYAPITTLVVYFSLNALVSNGEVNLNSLRHGLIILSFVLGFFSGRTMELLNRLKILLLPHNRTKPGEAKASKESQKKFEDLSIEEQQQIMENAIEENEEKWKTIYSNLSHIAAGNKYEKGKNTNVRCLVFYVKEKVEDIQALEKVSEVPKHVNYQGFEILTDVQLEEDLPVSQNFNPPVLDPDEFYNRMPGCGVSRIDSDEMGSIGVVVYRDDKQGNRTYFLLSCFHVLCPVELNDNWDEVSENKFLGKSEVVCPSLFDDKNKIQDNIVADINEGVLTSYVDAAIARLRKEDSILDLKDLKKPIEIYDLTPEDEDNLIVYMRGRVTTPSSKIKKGKKVKHISSNPTILYTISNRYAAKTMKRLIQTEKISSKGDSGGPVYTEDGKLVGIIVAGSSKYSYIIPIKHIMNRLDVQV